MLLRTIADVENYLYKEISNYRSTISFTAGVINTDIIDIYKRLLTKSPELVLCVDNISVKAISLGLLNDYIVTVTYSGIYSSFVCFVDSENTVKRCLLNSVTAHRKYDYFVCRTSETEMVLSAIKSIVAFPEYLNLYISGVQSSIIRRSDSEHVGIIVRLMYQCDYRTAKERIRRSNEEIHNIARIARLSGEEDWVRAYAVMRYCVNNWKYEQSTELGTEHTSFGALVNKKAVCMGFSLALCGIFKELGIPCKYICGIRNGEGHAWNMVFINGGWFYIDVTDAIGMNDPLFRWGCTRFDDRIVTTLHGQQLCCNCDKAFILHSLHTR